MIKNLCQGIRKVFLNGLGKASFIEAKFVDKLFQEILHDKTSIEKYKYIHAIGPFIFDTWNSTFSDNVFICYYKQHDVCPISLEQLLLYWERPSVGLFRDFLR